MFASVGVHGPVLSPAAALALDVVLLAALEDAQDLWLAGLASLAAWVAARWERCGPPWPAALH